MLIVGLTGGISSGKSTVSSWFIEKGITVIDADAIVKTLQAPHSELLKSLADTFGPHVIEGDGSLNRTKLAQLIFSSEEAKIKINEMIHPRVKKEMALGIEKAKENDELFVVLDVPLLFESQFTDLVDIVLVVYVSKETQIQRLMKRDQIDADFALKKIESQLPLDKKRDLADIVLNNEGCLSSLKEQFNTVYEQLLHQAKNISLDK